MQNRFTTSLCHATPINCFSISTWLVCLQKSLSGCIHTVANRHQGPACMSTTTSTTDARKAPADLQPHRPRLTRMRSCAARLLSRTSVLNPNDGHNTVQAAMQPPRTLTPNKAQQSSATKVKPPACLLMHRVPMRCSSPSQAMLQLT